MPDSTDFGSSAQGLLVFAGKPVGLACVRFLIDAGHPIAHVVIAHESDEELLALVRRAKLPYHIYGSRENTLARLQGRRFTWLLNLWSSHILPSALLALAEHRLNIHPSYAPYGLGSDSATWAIRERTPAGVSLLEMEAGIDRGGIYAQRAIAEIFPETGKALFARLKHTAIELFQEEWPAIQAGRLLATPQTRTGSYHTTKMTRSDRSLDGAHRMSVGEMIDWALAHDFAPLSGAEVTLNGEKFQLTVQLTPCAPASNHTPQATARASAPAELITT